MWTRQQPRYAFEQGAFARSVGANDRCERARRKRTADVVQRRVLAVAHREVAQGNAGCCAGLGRSRACHSGTTSTLAHSTASHSSTSAGSRVSTRSQAGQASTLRARKSTVLLVLSFGSSEAMVFDVVICRAASKYGDNATRLRYILSQFSCVNC
jgi:hypothetical protein